MDDQIVKEVKQDINKELKEKNLEVLFDWEAEGRTFKKRDKEFFINIGVLIFAISLIFLFFKEFILILTLWVIFASFYFFSTVEPQKVRHRITNKGAEFAGYEYKWEDLTSFYFGTKNDQDILFLNTKKALPGQIYFILNNQVNVDEMYAFLSGKLEFIEKPLSTWFDQMVEKFTDKFSLE